MSIKFVEYIPCSKCSYTLIGETETQLFIAKIGELSVFEVTTIWICLKCQHIQDTKIGIREIREN